MEILDQRPVNQDGFIDEWPEKGFIAMSSPYDPKASILIENDRVIEMDGKNREEFDFIDEFIADHYIDVKTAEGSMSLSPIQKFWKKALKKAWAIPS